MSLPAAGRGLASVSAPSGLYVAYSAGSNETALDHLGPDDADPNSLFTRSLLRHIDGSTPVDLIIKKTRSDVIRIAGAIGHKQHPAIYDQSVRDVRLDGAEASGGAQVISSGTVRIADGAALVIGVSRFRDMSFPGTIHDAENLSGALEELGVRVATILNPQIATVRAALAGLAAHTGPKIVYVAGVGTFDSGEAYVFLNEGKGSRASFAEYALPVSELVRDLSKTGSPGYVFIDAGLDEDLAVGIKPSGTTLSRLARGEWPKTALNREVSVAVLSSSNFYQVAADQQQGALNSPFQIALANALARPDLPLAQFANVVRQEVEDMTKGTQTPALFAPDHMRSKVIVRRH
jgi:hypothetical protein